MKGYDYRLGYRADLEGLRAVAILLVVAVHAGVPGLSGGFVGVDVFFVLSGFLITGLLVQEVSSTGRLRFADFYMRRLRRLLPALLTMLLVVCVLASLLLAPVEQRDQSSAAATAVLWLSNIHFAFASLDYFAPGTETNLFLHTWSLGVEEQFYLIWPALLVWLLGKDGARGVKRLKIGMLVVLLVSLLACMALTYRAPQLAFYMMPLRAWEFAAGALVWLYFQVPQTEGALRNARAPFLRAAGWLGLVLIGVASMLFGSNMAYPGAWALVPVAGAAGIVAAGSVAATVGGGVSRLLSWRPLQMIGRVSYAWYLWHWPVLLLGRAVTGSDAPAYRVAWVLLSLLLASLSYVCIESPIRGQKRWQAHPRMAIFGALALMLLANSLCLRWYSHATDRLQSLDVRRYAMAHVDAPVIYGMGCDDWYHSDRVRICAFGAPNAAHTAVLMGDSHAGQWFPAVAEAFNRPRWRLLVLTKSSCPMADEPVFYARIGREYTECATWRRHALAQVAAVRPDVVLLASAIAGGFTKDQWIVGTVKVLDVLGPASGRIYLLHDTPRLPFDGPDCLAEQVGRPAWLGLKHMCSASSADAHADQVYRWLGEAASRFHNVRLLDLNALVCPDGTCSAERQGKVVFRDSQHLTGSFAASLGPALANRLGMGSLPAAGHAQSSSGVPVTPH
jgi:peptidoglycan/LPS O-acetylase OafA/YrhL